MKGKNTGKSSDFIPYDDTKLEHVSAGPDYGGPGSGSHAWSELASEEYPDYVAEVLEKILSNQVRIDSSRH